MRQGVEPQVRAWPPTYFKLGSLCVGLIAVIWTSWEWVGYYPEIKEKLILKSGSLRESLGAPTSF